MRLSPPESNWRTYQNRNRKRNRKLRFTRRAQVAAMLFVCFGLAAVFFPFEKSESPEKKASSVHQKVMLTQKQVRDAVSDLSFETLTSPTFPIRIEGESMQGVSTLAPDLQAYLAGLVGRAEAAGRGRPSLLALVAMDPATGKVTGLAGSSDQTEGGTITPALTLHPAASIFKIVSAVAVMETAGYRPDTLLKFNGNMYTLYKRQMSEKTNRYTNRIRLKDAFAKSANPVFGKIGYHTLKQPGLTKYAAKFGFGAATSGTLPVPANEITITETPYQWAEVASGFNRNTRITPIHGARMAASVASGGRLPDAVIVEKIVDAKGRIRYQNSGSAGWFVMAPETALHMAELMHRTITRGTSRKNFSGWKRDPALQKLFIGGKTGSIYNRSHDVKYDWFVGYGTHPDGRKLAVSIMVGHGAYIGKRAASYAREILRYWFDPRRGSGTPSQIMAQSPDPS